MIDVDAHFEAPFRLAEAISRDIGATAIAFVVQTTVDVHRAHAVSEGSATRRLDYTRDDGGWVLVEETPQPWESAYFFEDELSNDDASDEDIARYEAARRAGNASSVMDLIHPSSTERMHRVCTTFNVRPDQPHGRWKKQSFFSRLFRRG